MVFRIPEISAESAQDRYAHDLKFIQDMTDKLLDPDEPSVVLKRIIRLGPRSTERIRPVKLIFSDASASRLLLSRAGRLKGMNVHMRADLDPEKRELLKAAVVELKHRLANGETVN